MNRIFRDNGAVVETGNSLDGDIFITLYEESNDGVAASVSLTHVEARKLIGNLEAAIQYTNSMYLPERKKKDFYCAECQTPVRFHCELWDGAVRAYCRSCETLQIFLCGRIATTTSEANQ